MADATRTGGIGPDRNPPSRDAVGATLERELDPDEELLWYASPDRAGIRRLLKGLAILQAVALLGGIGLFVSIGAFGPLAGGMFAVMLVLAAGVDLVLYRYLAGIEAGATDRRLVVTGDVPLIGSRETVAWDQVERIRARTPTVSLLVAAGTVQVERGGRFGRLLGTGRVQVPFVSDPKAAVRRLEAIREEHARDGGSNDW